MKAKRWWLFGWPMPHFDRLIGGGAGGFTDPNPQPQTKAQPQTTQPQPQTTSYTISFKDFIAAGEHIVQMSDDELREICRILKLDTSGEHTELANRVLAHSNLEALAGAVTQVKAGN